MAVIFEANVHHKDYSVKITIELVRINEFEKRAVLVQGVPKKPAPRNVFSHPD